MKLGEALNQRSDLQKRLEQLGKRLADSAVVQEGEEPPEDPDELLGELRRSVDELRGLVAAVNRTNAATRLPGGETVTDALARRDALAAEQGVLRRAIGDVGLDRLGLGRYSRSEIRTVRTLDVRGLRKRIDDLARERRELDTALQEHNWTVEVIES